MEILLERMKKKVYNSNVKIEWSIIYDLKQKPIRSDMNNPLSLYELEQAIKITFIKPLVLTESRRMPSKH